MKPHFKAIVFDFDGVIVDSEFHHFKAYQQALACYGYLLSLSFSEYKTIAHHKSGIRFKEYIWQTIHPSFPFDEMRKKKQHIYLDMLQDTPFPLTAGFQDLLVVMKERNLPFVVVTNAKNEEILLHQHHLPLLQQIPHWITRDDIQHPKPHPEGYLKALSLLAIPPQDVIGIEDSPKGLEALEKAGIRPILFSEHSMATEVEIENQFSSFSSFITSYFP